MPSRGSTHTPDRRHRCINVHQGHRAEEGDSPSDASGCIITGSCGGLGDTTSTPTPASHSLCRNCSSSEHSGIDGDKVFLLWRSPNRRKRKRRYLIGRNDGHRRHHHHTMCEPGENPWGSAFDSLRIESRQTNRMIGKLVCICRQGGRD